MSDGTIEGTIENRSNFRPPTPQPGLSARLDVAMEALAKRKKWNLVAHGSMLSFTLICIAAVWWSISLRLPLLELDTEQMRQANQLRNRLEQARLQEDGNVEQKVLQRMDMHEKELFHDRKALVDWLRNQIAVAQQQGIALHYTLGGIGPALVTHHVMALQLQLKIIRQSKQSSYAHFVRFVEQMSQQSSALHIDRVSMQGGGHGVTTMAMQVTIWML